MGVTADWDDANKGIIRYTFTGNWTWGEFEPCLQKVISMLDSAAEPIGLIADMRASAGIPLGMLMHVRRIADMAHPRAGLTVFIGLGALGRAVGQVFERAYPRSAKLYKWAIVDTEEEAYPLLEEWRHMRRSSGQQDTNEE